MSRDSIHTLPNISRPQYFEFSVQDHRLAIDILIRIAYFSIYNFEVT